ncbi:hypothetical protein AGMMS49938_03420 [Fibrobacterales bacterium]|nr:hypothetical protein AGMMS49938_03420 [Fibrobacterales bacterium]
MPFVFLLFFFCSASFAQIDLVKQQAEINSAKADLEEARQQRDLAVAKRWQERAKQNEERETLDAQVQAKKEKLESVLAERARLFEELRIARENLEFAQSEAEKSRAAFMSLSPTQDRVSEFKELNRNGQTYNIPEVSISGFKDSPLQSAEILFGLAKNEILHNREIPNFDSLTQIDNTNLALIDPLLNAGLATVIKEPQTNREKFEQFFREGGILMYPIFAMLIIALALIVQKLISLRIHSQRKMLKAIEKIVAGSNSRADAEKSFEEFFAKVVPKFESHLSAISVLGTTAPLLGLLGTVMGMIELFDVITLHGTADPKLLAGGISLALITTEAGLSVAIPIHLLHTWLAGRVEKRISKLDYEAIKILNEKFKP